MKRFLVFRSCIFPLIAAAFSIFPAFAGIFGTVRGVVHDVQHRPIPDITVVLKAENSDYTKTTQSNADGEFHFDAVPLGQYVLTINKDGFAPQQQRITVLSGTAPILHLELQLATQSQSVTVTSGVLPAQTESITPTTLITREDIAETIPSPELELDVSVAVALVAKNL